MVDIGPTLETPRLILRPPQRQDFEAWAAFGADEEAMQFLGGTQLRLVAWRTLTSAVGTWVIQGFSMFSVIEKSSGRWIGRVGPLRPEGWPGTEVGWGVIRDVWGQGYATEAARAAMDFAVDHLGWTEIIHCIDAGNHASQRVARRLGSSLLRRAVLPLPNEQDEIDVWGQSAEAWRAQRQA